MNINWANVFNIVSLLKCFIVGGLICVIGQILIDKTKLTPARILVTFVTTGAILGGLGIYKYLVNFAGAGATVPLTGFGYNLAKGVIQDVKETGLVGAFTGGVKASARWNCCCNIFWIYCFVNFKTQNKKTVAKYCFFIYYAFFAISAISVNAFGSLTAISANIFLFISTLAFFNPDINLLYVSPFILAAALILVIHNFLKSLFLSFLPT